MFQHILLATDFGPSSRRAEALAIDIARAFNAKLTLVHVYEIPSYVYAGAPYTPADLITPIREGATKALDDELSTVRAAVPGATSVLRNGRPADEILHVAKDIHADLLVVGTHGRRGVPRALLGSVAERLVRTAPIPVLTTHA